MEEGVVTRSASESVPRKRLAFTAAISNRRGFVEKFDAGQRRECFIAPAPVRRMDLENWMWKTRKIRIRGGDPTSCGCPRRTICRSKDIDRFLEKFDEYKRAKNA